MRGLWPSVPLTQHDDDNAEETQEWLESLDAVVREEGSERASYLISRLHDIAYRQYGCTENCTQSSYINTLSNDHAYPGDPTLERNIYLHNLWNLFIMVSLGNKDPKNLGGHIATYASSALLYNVGLLHTWRSNAHGQGDLVYVQGHACPGIYAFSYLAGQLSEEQLRRFRMESTHQGLSSYPHPWLMNDYWNFPTVSMGIAPVHAISQARFMRYLSQRGLSQTHDRHVWAMLGDGEMDEPESTGLLSCAGRERLDNLIFVVNCNLQRLDGPVRGNGKIVQELESVFRGAGWYVIKVLWSSGWDRLFAEDHDQHLRQELARCLDGEFQSYYAQGTAGFARAFFSRTPRLQAMIADWTEEELNTLTCGGHDPVKIYSAYQEAMAHQGQPVAILVHTVKGFGMGEAGEGRNIAHQQKKMPIRDLQIFRERFSFPATDEDIEHYAFKRLPEQETQYIHEHRNALGGHFPGRQAHIADTLPVPDLSIFHNLCTGSVSGTAGFSTTTASVRCITALLRDKQIGRYIVPIVPDESRTFGLEPLFRQFGIWSPVGQLYTPQDAKELSWYRESESGQIMQEGLCEANGIASWTSSGSSYSVHNVQTIPFYIFYSMFGFQRVGDFIWAAADSCTRGFLLGATSGRTTLNGEGLQHADGHSLLMAYTVPNCIAYDPAFAYEVAIIIHDGLQRMVSAQENVFYYLTIINENHVQDPLPENITADLLKGLYCYKHYTVSKKKAPAVQLMGAGAILHEVIAAAELLQTDFAISSVVWSAPSFVLLARDGHACERHNRLHPMTEKRVPFATQQLSRYPGPVIASTDYVRAIPELIRAYVPGRYHVLGTDGFGRADLREALRSFFEVDRYHVVIAALTALVEEGTLSPQVVQDAITRYGIDTTTQDPWTC